MTCNTIKSVGAVSALPGCTRVGTCLPRLAGRACAVWLRRHGSVQAPQQRASPALQLSALLVFLTITDTRAWPRHPQRPHRSRSGATSDEQLHSQHGLSPFNGGSNSGARTYVVPVRTLRLAARSTRVHHCPRQPATQVAALFGRLRRCKGPKNTAKNSASRLEQASGPHAHHAVPGPAARVAARFRR